MKISKKAHYGLQACYYLAQVYGKQSISAKELEKKIFVSSKYIERIMHALSDAKLVEAKKGVAGGYYLSKSPSEIKVGEVVRTLEDDLEIFDCVKKQGCTKCPSAVIWRNLYTEINKFLDSISLEEMIKDT